MRTLNYNVLNHFPNIELFYNITYKKVSNYNLILAIPQGNKCFIWFTKINNKYSMVLINKNINKIYLLNNKFNSELLETILYGTSFEIENKLYFSIEDLFYYKQTNVSFEPFINKLNIINDILMNDIYKINDYNNSIILGIPPISTNYSELNNMIINLPYEIKELKYILQNENQLYVKYKNNKQQIHNQNVINHNKNITNHNQNATQHNIFKVIPDIRTDIYNLHLLNKSTNEYEFHSIAFIPNYKSSVMMNKLFHGLKDHNNLDYLEDSDDEFISEDELENNWKLMKCIFDNKFKKWVPIKVIEN
jgi:hypothetical protein